MKCSNRIDYAYMLCQQSCKQGPKSKPKPSRQSLESPSASRLQVSPACKTALGYKASWLDQQKAKESAARAEV
eukprot:scaffold8931_cov13-Tisochrysis_lutea.AAC.1